MYRVKSLWLLPVLAAVTGGTVIWGCLGEKEVDESLKWRAGIDFPLNLDLPADVERWTGTDLPPLSLKELLGENLVSMITESVNGTEIVNAGVGFMIDGIINEITGGGLFKRRPAPPFDDIGTGEIVDKLQELREDITDVIISEELFNVVEVFSAAADPVVLREILRDSIIKNPNVHKIIDEYNESDLIPEAYKIDTDAMIDLVAAEVEKINEAFKEIIPPPYLIPSMEFPPLDFSIDMSYELDLYISIPVELKLYGLIYTKDDPLNAGSRSGASLSKFIEGRGYDKYPADYFNFFDYKNKSNPSAADTLTYLHMGGCSKEPCDTASAPSMSKSARERFRDIITGNSYYNLVWVISLDNVNIGDIVAMTQALDVDYSLGVKLRVDFGGTMNLDTIFAPSAQQQTGVQY